ncbi:hypothetical protein [Reyranella sp.]|jgi:hypothetical protein|uniref:hypothetical protein n=1 Tax=Reyranella sp. TaxID=1929291 RepID=UPI002F926FEE
MRRKRIATMDAIARRICRTIGSGVLPPDAVGALRLAEVRAGMSLAIERGWLRRRGQTYELTEAGLELARRSRAGANRKTRHIC